MTFQTLKLSQIEASKNNPRKSFDEETIAGLAQSIKIDGLLQNLIVAKPKGKKKTHPIICGERRFRALKLLEEQGALPKDFEVPVEIKTDLSEEEALRIATMENMQRENMPPLDEAKVLAQLVKDGEKLDDIVAQTGLSIGTIRRRLALMDLSPEAQDALSACEITLSQAEALSIGNHEKQNKLLGHVTDNDAWLSTAEDIKDRIVGRLPTLSMAIFDVSEYQGEFTKDLLTEDHSTYFNDVEQFLELQKAAAEKLVEEYAAKSEWTELLEGNFRPWLYNEAEDDETGGVIVAIDSSGEVEIHEGLIKSKADEETAKAIAKPRATYSRPLVKHMSMHKSIAVQAALLDNERAMKELAVAEKLVGFRDRNHQHLSYFDKEESTPPALQYINAKAKEVYALFKQASNDTMWRDLGSLFYCVGSAYQHVKTLSDENLETVLLTLNAMEFGQTYCDHLDTHEDSPFNIVAKDLNVDMRNYWRPDEGFLKRRNKVQLQKIITEAGGSHKFGSAAAHKKKDLVSAMAQYFQHVLTLKAPTEDELKAIYWLPEAMQFPAIDPDYKDDPEEALAPSDDFDDTEIYGEAA